MRAIQHAPTHSLPAHTHCAHRDTHTHHTAVPPHRRMGGEACTLTFEYVKRERAQDGEDVGALLSADYAGPIS
jgi:hypothetical protein